MTKYFTIKEAAALVGKSPKTVRRAIKKGTLTTELTKGKYKILASSLASVYDLDIPKADVAPRQRSEESSVQEPTQELPAQVPVQELPAQEPPAQVPVQEPPAQVPYHSPYHSPAQELAQGVVQEPVQEPVQELPVQELPVHSPTQEPTQEPPTQLAQEPRKETQEPTQELAQEPRKEAQEPVQELLYHSFPTQNQELDVLLKLIEVLKGELKAKDEQLKAKDQQIAQLLSITMEFAKPTKHTSPPESEPKGLWARLRKIINQKYHSITKKNHA